MMIELLILVVIFLIPFALYKWTTRGYDYFKERNIKSLTLKDMLRIDAGLLFNRFTAIDFAKSLYESFPEES